LAQQIRLTQYVITYGPGAILEGPNGPRVILGADIGLFNANADVTPEMVEISDQRMSEGMLRGARIFRLPSNAELRIPENRYIYRTAPFPSWSLCLNTNGHRGDFAVLYRENRCPVCHTHGQRRRDAIRFVRACPSGHLDDVDWRNVVHGGSRCAQASWYRWHGGGRALNRVEIECPECRRRANLGQAYGRAWPCSGRYPEREPDMTPVRSNCAIPSRMIQRQASNLRVNDLVTLFTIPPRATRLHNLLQSAQIRAVAAALGPQDFVSSVEQWLGNMVARQAIPHATADQILAHPRDELLQALEDILSPVGPDTGSLLSEEFRALLDASVNGAPSVHGTALHSPVLFEVNRSDVRRYPGPGGIVLRVTPVSRLRTVTVQLGYRREVSTASAGQAVPASRVPVSFVDSANRDWYPGAELLGEGVFLCLEEDDGWHAPLGGASAAKWQQAWQRRPTLDHSAALFRTAEMRELHPVFVWWHSLSHLLMKSISLDAGYSAAAIRERVYLELTGDGTGARGGLVLYATQPGSEGTLGGLIALVPQFDRILERAVAMARLCSNDPLCIENKFAPGRYSGPACYACLLVSETSCEHRNLWLDRDVLLANLP